MNFTLHLHLLIRTGSHPLSNLMREVLSGYALSFNRQHKRHGYLFHNRYKSILCQEEEYLLELVRYIHLNPLRAALVKNLDELDRYRWSGHAVLMGRRRRGWQNRAGMGPATPGNRSLPDAVGRTLRTCRKRAGPAVFHMPRG